jgi:hypothetical protein
MTLERRTPMPRGNPPQRRTPLRTYSELRNTTPLLRRAELERTPFESPPKDTGPTKTVTDMVKDRAREAFGETPAGRPYCEVCSLNPGYQRQHRIARGMGGTDNPAVNRASNILWVCGAFGSWSGCHHMIEHRERARAFVEGWALPFGTDPLQHKVLLADGEWLLTDDGGRIPHIPKGTAA